MEELTPPVFVSYARRDLDRAREVYRHLTRSGISCWMDETQLRTGQDWKLEIDKAIRACHIFVACLSTNSVDHRGFFQTELRTAYEVWKTMPSGQPFLLPIRLDECEIPQEVQSAHSLDFFHPEGSLKLVADVLHYLAPELPALRLSKALEHIRLGRLDSAREILTQLKAAVDDHNPDLLLRVLYDIACVHSLLAESTTAGSKQRSDWLIAAIADLKQWYDYGSSRAWLRTGRTAQNEVYRMGSDGDLRFVLAEGAAKIKKLLGPNAGALPKTLPPKRSGGGGGCVPVTQVIDTPSGSIRFEDLRVGSSICSYLPNANMTPLTTRVVQIYTFRETECVILNKKVIMTPSQPVIDSTNQLQLAGALQIGSRLRAAGSAAVTIESVEKVIGHFEVGTLTTDHPTHNFICGGFICGNGPKN